MYCPRWEANQRGEGLYDTRFLEGTTRLSTGDYSLLVEGPRPDYLASGARAPPTSELQESEERAIGHAGVRHPGRGHNPRRAS